jgi:hypothetical protein
MEMLRVWLGKGVGACSWRIGKRGEGPRVILVLSSLCSGNISADLETVSWWRCSTRQVVSATLRWQCGTGEALSGSSMRWLYNDTYWRH